MTPPGCPDATTTTLCRETTYGGMWKAGSPLWVAQWDPAGVMEVPLATVAIRKEQKDHEDMAAVPLAT